MTRALSKMINAFLCGALCVREQCGQQLSSLNEFRFRLVGFRNEALAV